MFVDFSFFMEFFSQILVCAIFSIYKLYHLGFSHRQNYRISLKNIYIYIYIYIYILLRKVCEIQYCHLVKTIDCKK